VVVKFVQASATPKKVAISSCLECVYLREFETGSQARQELGEWFHFYNEQRPQKAFDGRCPMDVFQERNKVTKPA